MTQSGVPLASSSLRSLLPPPWVEADQGEVLASGAPWIAALDSVPTVNISGEFAFVSARIAGAAAMDAATLEAQVSDTYGAIAETLAGLRQSCPVRFWNYIPDIHAPMEGGLSRYMVFNAGRFRAMSRWLGGLDQIHRRVATATGVGHDGDDLHIHCLASPLTGRAVDNPRQIPAYRYSKRYGPVPPCFSRGTAIRAGDRDLLLVGGTASVRGEHSVNGASIEQQLLETFTNLAALVRAWLGSQDGQDAGDAPALALFQSLRAYCVDPAHLQTVQAMIESRFTRLESLEIVQGCVCRPELLVEIEGVARGIAP